MGWRWGDPGLGDNWPPDEDENENGEGEDGEDGS